MKQIVLMWLCLMISACSFKEQIKTCPKVPTLLTEETHVPRLLGNTWRDLAIHTLELREAAMQCNIDKALMREWEEEN